MGKSRGGQYPRKGGCCGKMQSAAPHKRQSGKERKKEEIQREGLHKEVDSPFDVIISRID